MTAPDTAALVARLRADVEVLPTLFGEETELNAPMVEIVDSVAFRCGRAADALEAQAARITELEAHNRRLATTMTGDTATDLRVLYAYELGLADHTLTTPTEETL